MPTRLESLITKVSLRMRLLEAKYDTDGSRVELNATQVLMLELLSNRQIAKMADVTRFFRGVADSTISTELSELHTKKFVEKGINPDNQRERTVRLTDLGFDILSKLKARKAKRLGVLMQAFGGIPENKRTVLEDVLNSILPALDNALVKTDSE